MIHKKIIITFCLIAVFVALLVSFWYSKENKLSGGPSTSKTFSQETATPPILKEKSNDGRLLLTSTARQEFNTYFMSRNNPAYRKVCRKEIFNEEPASTRVTYQDAAKGITMEIPWNPKWGNETYALLPYEEEDSKLLFGPVRIKGENYALPNPMDPNDIAYGPCRWKRASSLTFEPAESTATVIENAKKGQSLSYTPPFKEETFYGLPVLRHTEGDQLIVLGEKYNYAFSGIKDHMLKYVTIEGLTKKVVPLNERILLTADHFSRCRKDSGGDCPPADENFYVNDFYYDYPSKTPVQYSNEARGIEMQIPYNEEWGSDHYRISPFHEVGDTLAFGPAEWGDWYDDSPLERRYKITFKPQKSADEVVQEFQKSGEYMRTEKIMMNGLTVVGYNGEGEGAPVGMIIIGKKYNYDFPYCSFSYKIPGTIECYEKTRQDMLKTVRVF